MMNDTHTHTHFHFHFRFHDAPKSLNSGELLQSINERLDKIMATTEETKVQTQELIAAAKEGTTLAASISGFITALDEKLTAALEHPDVPDEVRDDITAALTDIKANNVALAKAMVEKTAAAGVNVDQTATGEVITEPSAQS